MDSDLRSRSLDNAGSKPSFRKPINDSANRKYRRRSPVSGSASSASGGSPNHDRSPSPISPGEDPTKKSDRGRRDEERELDRDAGRSRYGRSGDSSRHSSRQSYGSSHDYHRHDDYSRYHRRADDGERSYQRPSRPSRESRGGTRSDYMRQESEHDRSRDYWRNMDKHSRDKPDDAGRRSKDKERETTVLEHHKYSNKDSSSDRRHITSNVNETKTGERDSHNRDKGGGRDGKRDHPRSFIDYNNDHTSSHEESKGHGKDLTTGTDNIGNRRKETHRSTYKEFDGQKDAGVEKRKYDYPDLDRHKERSNREPGEIENDCIISSGYKERDVRNEQYEDKNVRTDLDQESLAKKPKLFNSGKDPGYAKDGQLVSKFTTSAGDERPPLSSKQVQETVEKATSQQAHSSASEVEAAHDLNAAKVAAMKAAELVNRNLVGGGYMSTDQKKKLLWGSKKSTAVEEPTHRWDVPLFTDRERQEKFNKLMGVKGDLNLEHKPEDTDGSGLLLTEKQKELQLDLEKQYTAGLRRRDGRTVGLGL